MHAQGKYQYDFPTTTCFFPRGVCALPYRYGMLTHIVYDVYIKGDEDYENEEGLRGTSRFADDFDAFTKEGLQFKQVTPVLRRHRRYNLDERSNSSRCYP